MASGCCFDVGFFPVFDLQQTDDFFFKENKFATFRNVTDLADTNIMYGDLHSSLGQKRALILHYTSQALVISFIITVIKMLIHIFQHN